MRRRINITFRWSNIISEKEVNYQDLREGVEDKSGSKLVARIAGPGELSVYTDITAEELKTREATMRLLSNNLKYDKSMDVKTEGLLEDGYYCLVFQKVPQDVGLKLSLIFNDEKEIILFDDKQFHEVSNLSKGQDPDD